MPDHGCSSSTLKTNSYKLQFLTDSALYSLNLGKHFVSANIEGFFFSDFQQTSNMLLFVRQ